MRFSWFKPTSGQPAQADYTAVRLPQVDRTSRVRKRKTMARYRVNISRGNGYEVDGKIFQVMETFDSEPTPELEADVKRGYLIKEESDGSATETEE